MNVFLFSILFLLVSPNTETPNFYSSFSSARNAARTTQKEMLVFFSKTTCPVCDPAWEAFEKDAAATLKYISTKMDAENFDGSAFFEKYELSEVPAWVILTPDGLVKEKWVGGWKDGSGNPTLFVQDESKKQEVKASGKNNSSVVTQTKTSTPTNSTSPTTSSTNGSSTISKTDKSVIPSSTAVTPVTSENITTGFVLQAGYFGSEANAQKLLTDLKGKGFSSYVAKTTQQNGSTFYRVVSKTFISETEANRELQSLSTAGIKATLKKASEI